MSFLQFAISDWYCVAALPVTWGERRDGVPGSLIYGLVLAVIPVVLHLLMKARPKQLIFPALRLIRRNRVQNVRRIRLRHLWLLLLRMLAIAGVVMAITRPSLPAANYSLTTSETLSLLAICGLLLAAYFAVLSFWKRKRVPAVTMASRRTSLRGGLGFAAFLLIALLVAWPWQQRVSAELTAPLPPVSPDIPAAAVMVFDSSLSMSYQQDGKTRLAVAQEIALEQLSALNARSRVAIADLSSNAAVLFQADLTGARNRIEALQTRPLFVPLNDRVRTALTLQDEDRRRTVGRSDSGEAPDLFVREIYLFTDLAASGWRASAARLLREELVRSPWLSVYVIDVGVENPRSVALHDLTLSTEVANEDVPVTIEASVSSIGVRDESVTVELWVQGENGEPVKRGQRSVRLAGLPLGSEPAEPQPAGGADPSDAGPSGNAPSRSAANAVRPAAGSSATGERISFTIEPDGVATARGELRLVTNDVMNRLWFSIGTRPPVTVLVSAPARSDSENDIIASDANEAVGVLETLGYDFRFVPSSQLEAQSLLDVHVVLLVNVPAPSSATWNQLEAFVSAGGGLLAFLGSADLDTSSGIRATDWNVPEAQAFLPGELAAALKFRPPHGLDVKETTHPVLRPFDRQGVVAEIAQTPVWRYWKIEPAEDASVIARFTDSRSTPAIIERAHGAGRSMFLATGGNLTLDLKRQWSRLAGEWPFLSLVDQSIRYLSRTSEARFNYECGEDVMLRLDRRDSLTDYLLRQPSGLQTPGRADPEKESLFLSGIDETGHFTVRSSTAESKFEASFSINPPSSESDFTRLRPIDLDNYFGAERYSLVSNLSELQRTVSSDRQGVEVFPLVLGLALILFCLELIVASRFYETDQSPGLATQS